MVKFKLIKEIPLPGFDQFQVGDFVPAEVFYGIGGELQRECFEIITEQEKSKKSK